MSCKFVDTFKIHHKYAKLLYFDQMSNNKTPVHIRPWQVTAQAHMLNMQMAVFCYDFAKDRG